MAAGEGPRAGGRARPGALRRWRRACAWSRSCCTRGCPSRPSRLLTALGSREDRSLESARLGADAGGADDRRAGPALPEGRGARALGRLGDRPGRHGRHPLPPRLLRAARADLVERARARGSRGSPRWACTASRSGARSAAANEYDEVVAIVGRHPHHSEGFGDADLEEIEAAAADPLVRAIGETGLDYFRDRAPRDDQRRAFEAQLDLAARLGLPVVIHTRAAEEDTFADPRRARGRRHRDPALLLGPRPAGRVRGARVPVLVRRQRDLPEGRGPAGRGPARPVGAPAGGDRLALPQPAAGARQAQRAGQRGAHRRASWPSCAAWSYAELDGTVHENARRVFGW